MPELNQATAALSRAANQFQRIASLQKIRRIASHRVRGYVLLAQVDHLNQFRAAADATFFNGFADFFGHKHF
jgi:hypothetical protein